MAVFIDIGTLLEPISEEMPAGPSLIYDPVYDAIRDARREDNPHLPQGIWQTDLKKADWHRVRDLCEATLRDRSKDLQVAAWLMEAMMQMEGFAGLRRGLEAMYALSERYWEEIHPMPEDGNLEYRMAPLVWVNEKLGGRVRLLPVTSPAGGDLRAHSFADLESAQRLENQARKNPRAFDQAPADAVTLADFNASAMATPDDFYRAADKDIAACLLLSDRFSEFLTLRCAEDAASFGRLRRALDEVGRMVHGMVRDRHVMLGEESPAQEDYYPETIAMNESTNGNGAGSNGASPIGGPPIVDASAAGLSMSRGPLMIHSREEAYSILGAVADYLIRVEPHSPAPYLVKRAVAWGGLPLGALLMELVGEGGDLMEIYRLLGINDGSMR